MRVVLRQAEVGVGPVVPQRTGHALLALEHLPERGLDRSGLAGQAELALHGREQRLVDVESGSHLICSLMQTICMPTRRAYASSRRAPRRARRDPWVLARAG